MNFDYSSGELKQIIDYSITDKLCDSIAKMTYKIETEDGVNFRSGFFIKLNIDERDIPFFCTALHDLKTNLDKANLILNKKDKYGNNFEMQLIIDKSKKLIIDYLIFDIKFIEILDEEIPKGLTLSFLELEETNLNNPNKYIDSQSIMAGYPKKYLLKNKKIPLISYGKIIKIIEENDIKKVFYNMETDEGSSGAPICIINEKDELKLIAIHNQHNPNEKIIYNIGILLGPIIKLITNQNIINVNTNDEIKNVENIMRSISDKFDGLSSKIFLIDNFITYENYQKIIFYHKKIVEEYEKLNNDRFKVYFCLLNNHILIYAHDKLRTSMNKFLTILNNFNDTKYVFNMIKIFNDDIIINFNKILLSEDYNLKIKLIYFISAYIKALKENNCRYSYRDVKFYQRSLVNLDTLNKLKAKEKQKVMNLYFMNEVIPMTRFGNWYIYYKDIIMSVWMCYKLTIQHLKKTDYDTKIFIEQKYENNNQKVNVFQIYNWPEVVIAPFSCFIVESVEINNYDQTAEIKLTLLASEDEILEDKTMIDLQ